MYGRIGFIGLGLIGGSIAKAIRLRYPDAKLYARTHNPQTVAAAYRDGVIANDTPLSLEAFADMDLIFLCAPVQSNITYLKHLSSILSPHTLLTDVGSVKGSMMDAAASHGLLGQFIGGHPMTGSETIGFSHADPLLLENAYYILCADESADTARVDAFGDFIASLGALVMRLDADTHDHAVAAISHLPHIISASLVNLVKNSDDDDQLMRTIAAGGFRDITRISSSSPEMWQSICAENRDQILALLEQYIATLRDASARIAADESDAVHAFFSSAKDYRDALPLRDKGILPGTYDFYMDVADKPGAIATIARLLADADISIKNIGIVHNREFADGVLRIELYDAASSENAMHLLHDKGYHIHQR